MPDIPFSASAVAYLFCNGLMFAVLVPKYLLCPLLRRRRYSALLGALAAILLASLAIHALLTAGKPTRDWAAAFGGPLLSIWIALLWCGISRPLGQRGRAKADCIDGTNG